MAYRKPPWFARNVFNRLAMRFGLSGTSVLVTPGRRSGKPHRVPVIPVERDGERYVVSPRGESDWVKNLRAAGGRGELNGQSFSSVEIPVAERPPVLELYKDKAGRAVAGHFKALPDPADHPVFRID